MVSDTWTGQEQGPSCSRLTDPDKAFECSRDHRHQHGFRRQHTPWTSARPLVLIWAVVINTDPSCSSTTDPDMVLGGCTSADTAPGDSTGYSDQYGPHQPNGSKIPTWLQAAAHTSGILMAFSGSTSHRHQHRPWLQSNHRPRLGPQWQEGWPFISVTEVQFLRVNIRGYITKKI